MNDKLKLAIRKTSKAYVAAWIMIIFSVPATCMFQGSMGAVMLLVCRMISFWVSLGVLIYGVIQALKLHLAFRKENLGGSPLILASFGAMLVSLLLSIQSICGVNTVLVAQIELNHSFSRFFEEFKQDLSYFSVASIVAMLLFMASQVMIYLGVKKASQGEGQKYNVLVGTKRLCQALMALAIITLVFSPILLAFTNALGHADQELPVALDVVTAVLYLGALGAVIAFGSKYSEWVVADPAETPEVEKLTEIPISAALKDTLGQLGRVYLYTYAMIALSAAVIFSFFIFRWQLMVYLSLLIYIAAWGVVLYGLTSALRASKQLPAALAGAGKWLVRSFAALAVTTFLSFNSIFGANVALMDTNSPLLIFSTFAALVIFTLFPIFTFVAVKQLSRRLPAARKATTGAIVLLVASLILAPITLTLTSMMGILLVDLLALVVYGIGAYLLIKPWSSCDTILTDTPDVPDTAEAPATPWSPAEALNEVKRDRKLTCIAGAAAVSILVCLGVVINLAIDLNRTYEPRSIDEIYAEREDADEDTDEIDADDDSSESSAKTPSAAEMSRYLSRIVKQYITPYTDTPDTAAPSTDAYFDEAEGVRPRGNGGLTDDYADNAIDFFTYYSSEHAVDDFVEYSGFFEQRNKKFPIDLLFTITNDCTPEECLYTNVNYGTTEQMNIHFTRREMILTAKSGAANLTIRLSPSARGVWEGWAESGNQKLRATIYLTTPY